VIPLRPSDDDRRDDDEGEELFPPPSAAVMFALMAIFGRFAALMTLYPMMGARPATIGIATIVGFGFAFAIAARSLEQPPGPRLGFVPVKSSHAWRAVPFLLFSLLLVSELDNVIKELLPPPEGTGDPGAPGGTEILERALVIVAILPFANELLFRGVIQPGVVFALGRWRGVLMVAALQGAGAIFLYGPLMAPYTVPFALCYALILGLLREASGSLIPPLVLHALFGLITFAASLGAFGIPGFDDVAHAHTPFGWLLLSGICVGVGLGLCRVALRTAEPYTPPSPGPPEGWG
jgi:membrane protease YdiL (CAAX protease family)